MILILEEEKRCLPPGSGEADIFLLRETAREPTVKGRKLSSGRCTTEHVMAELEAARMLSRFTFNPNYVIGNKLALILLIGSTFSISQGAFAKKTSSHGHIHSLSRRLEKSLGAFTMLQSKCRTFE